MPHATLTASHVTVAPSISSSRTLALSLTSCEAATAAANITVTATAAENIRSNYVHKLDLDHGLTSATLVATHSEPVSTSFHGSSSTGSVNSISSHTGPIHISGMTTPLGECISRLEPLKIALESDEEDESVGSGSCFDSDDPLNDGCIPKSLDTQYSDKLAVSDYFHKKPHRLSSPVSAATHATDASFAATTPSNDNSSGTTTPLTSSSSSSSQDLDSVTQTCSGQSLPSFVNSKESIDTGLISIISSESTFGHSNKKPRYLGDVDGDFSTSRKRKKKTVSIHKSVSVISIPSRHEYSPIVRERIWTTASEIHANAARNAIEFCSEHWKWENALEDHQMFVHQGNGERVHPIHVHNAISLIDSYQGDPRNSEEIHFNLSLIAALVPPVSIRHGSGVDHKGRNDTGDDDVNPTVLAAVVCQEKETIDLLPSLQTLDTGPPSAAA